MTESLKTVAGAGMKDLLVRLLEAGGETVVRKGALIR